MPWSMRLRLNRSQCKNPVSDMLAIEAFENCSLANDRDPPASMARNMLARKRCCADRCSPDRLLPNSPVGRDPRLAYSLRWHLIISRTASPTRLVHAYGHAFNLEACGTALCAAGRCPEHSAARAAKQQLSPGAAIGSLSGINSRQGEGPAQLRTHRHRQAGD